MLMNVYYVSFSQKSNNSISFTTDESYDWEPVDDLHMCESFGFSESGCGSFVYKGLIPKVFKVSLSVQSVSPDGSDERVEFGLFRNCETCPVNEIFTPCYNNFQVEDSEKGNCIMNLVRVKHGDSFVVKGRFKDGSKRVENFNVDITNLKLLFF